MIPLPTSPRAIWVAALRSGEYKQHRGSLANRELTTFCCLGVMCDITPTFRWDVGYSAPIGSTPDDGLPVEEVLNVYGLTAKTDSPVYDLTKANDGGTSFEGIADIVASWEED